MQSPRLGQRLQLALALALLVAAPGAVALLWLADAGIPRSTSPAPFTTAPLQQTTGVDRLQVLRGIVLDARGIPLAGAQVEARPWLLPGPDWFRAAAAQSEAELLQSGGGGAARRSAEVVLASTRTGHAGIFTLLLLPDRYDLHLRAAGHAQQLLQDERPGGPLRIVELKTGWTIAGTLRRFSAGTRVEAAPLVDAERRPLIQTRAEPDGRFVLEGLGLGPYRVTAVDPSGEMASASPVQAGSGGLVLSLLPRRMLTGLVLDARDAGPVAGATVTIAGSGFWPPRTAQSDADGRYRFPAVPAGWYVLRAVEQPDRASGFLEGVIVPGGRKEVEQALVVEPQPIVELEVRRTSDGSTVADAQVSLAPFQPSVMALRGSTDARGRMPLGPLPPGRYQLTVRASGLVTVLEQPLEVAAAGQLGKPQLLPIAMLPAAALEGLVLDERGVPIASAELFAVSRDGVSGPLARAGDAGVRQHVRAKMGAGGVASQEAASRSGSTGRFHLDGLPPGEYNLLCLHVSHLPSLVGPFRLAPGQLTRGVEIRMETAGILSGQVVDAEGEPVLSAKVRFADQAGTATDARGRFMLTGVQGEGQLVVQAAGHAPVQRTVRVEPGAGGVPLLITLDTQGTPLAGFVLGPSGEEVAGAIVVVQGAGGLSTQVTSSSSGDFRLDSPPPPPWTVTVTAAGAARWQRQVPRLDGPLEVNLEAGGSLRLEVLEEGTFEPLSQVRVALRGPEQLQWSGRLANGYLAIDQLRPGRYTVEVEARGHLPGRREGVPVEDRRDPDPVRLLLARGGGLAGTVLDLEGSPLGGAEVRASPKSTASGARPLTVRTNATGAFRLSPLAEGPVELNVAAPGYEPDVRTERVVAGEDFTDLEFRLVPIW